VVLPPLCFLRFSSSPVRSPRTAHCRFLSHAIYSSSSPVAARQIHRSSPCFRAFQFPLRWLPLRALPIRIADYPTRFVGPLCLFGSDQFLSISSRGRYSRCHSFSFPPVLVPSIQYRVRSIHLRFVSLLLVAFPARVSVPRASTPLRLGSCPFPAFHLRFRSVLSMFICVSIHFAADRCLSVSSLI